jgi:hypothetical protein
MQMRILLKQINLRSAPALAVPPSQSEKDTRQQKTRRRHHGEAAASEEGDITHDLFLKHLDTTLATYIRRQIKYVKRVSETLAKIHKKNCNTHTTTR